MKVKIGNLTQWAWDAKAIRDANVKEFVREILGIQDVPGHVEQADSVD